MNTIEIITSLISRKKVNDNRNLIKIITFTLIVRKSVLYL